MYCIKNGRMEREPHPVLHVRGPIKTLPPGVLGRHRRTHECSRLGHGR